MKDAWPRFGRWGDRDFLSVFRASLGCSWRGSVHTRLMWKGAEVDYKASFLYKVIGSDCIVSVPTLKSIDVGHCRKQNIIAEGNCLLDLFVNLRFSGVCKKEAHPGMNNI